ncbi:MULTISPECIES: MaoC family dehydratase N-terminal domain-containing protein [unclassified Mycobacterium]|uniref:FAS1-like dehydratase domain-containing protein n=1 Tax=unclassified Mycobacterium TaxID=2642494 RepID=UPI0029C7E5C0|nr:MULTISPECIES: MaoC family dehydratase N-terminal domain-containing protein [unclassified Mycobacterium]
MVGFRSAPRVAASAVSAARIQMFAATIQDANPGFWDAEFAAEVWGGLMAPPALLMGWLIPTPWQPNGRPPTPSLATRIPLPGTTFINASNEVELLDPILEGDRLTVVEEVVSISPEKRTRLGTGHFVQTLETFYRGDGNPVAMNRNTLFRFTPKEQA